MKAVGINKESVAIPVVTILFLLTACGGINQFQSTNITPEISNISAFNEKWAAIHTENVESFCFTDSQKAAGEFSWAVRKCYCEELISNGIKQYYCDVITFDPGNTRYFIRMTCFKEGGTCSLQSNKGDSVFAVEDFEG